MTSGPIHNLKEGMRIRLTADMVNPDSSYQPKEDGMVAGTEGVVTHVYHNGDQVGMRWDNGQSILLLADIDSFEVIT